MSQFVLDRLQEKFASEIVSTHNHAGDETAIVRGARLVEIAQFLRDDEALSFEMLTDVTGVDYLGYDDEPRDYRFEVAYHFYSLTKRHRVRLRVRLPEEDPVVPSLIHLWKSATWMEREAFDLYGIRFDGHPDLRRVLLYPEFEGHPLRKDYALEQRQPIVPPWPGREHL